jgi:tetratricopeptide (TPR) repeat protein
MARKLERQELKRNELNDAVEASVEFAERHLKAILLTLGGAGLAALAAWGVWGWHQARVARASEMLGDALRVAQAEVVDSGAKPDDPVRPTFASEAAREARARQLFEQTAQKYPSSGPGLAATLWLGDRAFAAGDRAEARKLWQKVVDSGAEGTFAVSARVDLARLDRAEGKGEELLTRLKKELDSGTSMVPADVLLAEIARTYEALGKSADAQATWRRIVDEHPDSPYASVAQGQIAAGSPTA